jgi:hypothetical protein
VSDEESVGSTGVPWPAGRGLRQFFRQRSRSHGRNSARVVCVAQTPPLPEPWTNPILLIMSAANGHWFAAGIPKNDTDDQ